MFEHASLTPPHILVGFAGAVLAFSGLESISQLSPSMKTPRKKIIGMALFLVVITIGATSPLLTLLSTLLQQDKAADPVLSTQLISLLGGHWQCPLADRGGGQRQPHPGVRQQYRRHWSLPRLSGPLAHGVLPRIYPQAQSVPRDATLVDCFRCRHSHRCAGAGAR